MALHPFMTVYLEIKDLYVATNAQKNSQYNIDLQMDIQSLQLSHKNEDRFFENEDLDYPNELGYLNWINQSPPVQVARKKTTVLEAIQMEAQKLLEANLLAQREKLIDLDTKQLLVKFLGDVSEIVDTPISDWGDRQEKVFELLEKRAVRWFHCCGWNRNGLSEKETIWLTDNSEMIHRIVHRLVDNGLSADRQFKHISLNWTHCEVFFRRLMKVFAPLLEKNIGIKFNELVYTPEDEQMGKEIQKLLEVIADREAVADEEICVHDPYIGDLGSVGIFSIKRIFGPIGIPLGVLPLIFDTIVTRNVLPDVLDDLDEEDEENN